MNICPYCDAENIDGADECESCGISLSDLSLPTPATSVEADLLRDRVSLLQGPEPIAVSPETPVREALKKMVEEQVGCLLVVENDRLVGIFSERDALMKLNTGAGAMADRPIAQFATGNPTTIDDSAKIAFAIHQMSVGGYRHLPVLRGELPVSVISIRQILNYLTERIAAARSV